MGYFIIYLLEQLSWGVFWFLAIGVPLLIFWRIIKNRGNRGRQLVWVAAAVFWAVPSLVEWSRDRVLAAWIADLPPAPLVTLPEGAALGLVNGTYDASTGVVHFKGCPENRWQRPLCQFELGAPEAVRGYTLAVQDGEGWRQHGWRRGTDCPLYLNFTQLSEPFEAYFVAQGICGYDAVLPSGTDVFELAYHSGPLPGFSQDYFGQLTVFDGASGDVLTTLSSLAVTRPQFPVVWGVHWGKVFGALTPRRERTVRVGETMQEDFHLGQPPNSFQHLAYSIGWDGDKRDRYAHHTALETMFGYDPDRALPALRSDAFFPTRYALETVCSKRFKDRVTPAVVAQIKRVITSDVRFSNGYPKRLAAEVLQEGCGAGL